ncbi:hypothetical protein KFU94_70550 [Chloroflexi bacterium TSY]|nr:hypothetical protein [Chloroflexi bacterium TSY]
MINQDNGPENHTRRTSLCIVSLSLLSTIVSIQLACYPPYHSKYNPIERV